MNLYKRAVLGMLFSALLSGCASSYTNKQLQDVFNERGFQTAETDRGVAVFLPDVFFEFDKADLTYCAQLKIGEIAAVVNDPRGLQRNLLVEGHTDSSGSDEYNLDLSNKRAKSVEKNLVDKKVAAERIMARVTEKNIPLLKIQIPMARIILKAEPRIGA